jgi:hypothetical protein
MRQIAEPARHHLELASDLLLEAGARGHLVGPEDGAFQQAAGREHGQRAESAGNRRPRQPAVWERRVAAALTGQSHGFKNTIGYSPMSRHQFLKSTLKRGALVAAANWPVTFVQATADSLFKLLVAVPIVGGIFLVALVIGTAPDVLITLDWRDMVATTIGALLSRPLVLTAFLLAVGVVAVGGALFVYVVKAGTVAVLVRSEREAEAIEDLPLHAGTLTRASRFSVDFFIVSARRLFPRYARLGFMLMAVYLGSAAGYFSIVVTRAAGDGWLATALVTAAFVGWITVVNLLYLLTQIVIAADDCSVASAARRVAAFLRHERRKIVRVFVVVLAIVVGASGASVVAAGLLSLVSFVPFIGLAVLPLQLVAWLLRALVFQFIGLASVGAYLKLYRTFTAEFVRADMTSAPTYPLDPESRLYVGP